MAVDTERIDERIIKSFSTNGKKIRPVFDRLGKPIAEHTKYDDGIAIDIIVDGKPRYDYVETDEDVELNNEETTELGEN